MKVIIAGSRHCTNNKYYEDVKKAIEDSKFNITEVVCGGCSGIDEWGFVWSRDNQVDCMVKWAKWNKYDKKAGPLRNKEMAEYADALIVIMKNGEKNVGSNGMLELAENNGLSTFVVYVD